MDLCLDRDLVTEKADVALAFRDRNLVTGEADVASAFRALLEIV